MIVFLQTQSSAFILKITEHLFYACLSHYHSHFPSFLMTRSFCQTWACAWINQHWTARSIGPIVQNVWPRKWSLLIFTRRISIAGSPPSMQWKWYFGSLKKSKWQIVSILTEAGMFRCGLAGLVRRVNISAALSRHWLQCFQDRQKEAEDGADLEFGTTGITSRTSALLFQSGQNFTS